MSWVSIKKDKGNAVITVQFTRGDIPATYIYSVVLYAYNIHCTAGNFNGESFKAFSD